MQSFKKLFSFLLFISILSGSFSAFAQKKIAVASNTKTSASKCSGAWTGVITYTKAAKSSIEIENRLDSCPIQPRFAEFRRFFKMFQCRAFVLQIAIDERELIRRNVAFFGNLF